MLQHVASTARGDGLERRAQAVPARQVCARLGPREHPRDRAQRGDVGGLVRSAPTALGARRRPRAEAKAADQPDGRRRPEERREPPVLDERAIRGPGDGRELGHRGRAARGRLRGLALVLRRGGQERGGGHLLEVPPGDGDVGEVGRDDLTLLGELEAAIHRARGLREDRAVRRSAAAADGSAAPVEQREGDAVPPGDAHQRLLRPVEEPVRRQEPALLGRVGVAQHHLLGVATRPEMLAVGGVREQRVQQRRRPVEGLGGLQQRHDVEDGKRGRQVADGGGRMTERLGLRGAARQLQDVGHVLGRRREADDVPAAGLDAEAGLDARDGPERRQDLGNRDATRDLEVWFGSGVEGIQRGPVDRGVLAHLERCEVEPERRQLPAQVGELAVRDPRQPVGDERVLEHRQLGVQDGGRRGSRRCAAPSRRSARPGSAGGAPRCRPGADDRARPGSAGGAGGPCRRAPPRHGPARCRGRGQGVTPGRGPRRSA